MDIKELFEEGELSWIYLCIYIGDIKWKQLRMDGYFIEVLLQKDEFSVVLTSNVKLLSIIINESMKWVYFV